MVDDFLVNFGYFREFSEIKIVKKPQFDWSNFCIYKFLVPKKSIFHQCAIMPRTCKRSKPVKVEPAAPPTNHEMCSDCGMPRIVCQNCVHGLTQGDDDGYDTDTLTPLPPLPPLLSPHHDDVGVLRIRRPGPPPPTPESFGPLPPTHDHGKRRKINSDDLSQDSQSTTATIPLGGEHLDMLDETNSALNDGIAAMQDVKTQVQQVIILYKALHALAGAAGLFDDN